MKAKIVKAKKGTVTTIQLRTTDTSIPNAIRSTLQTEIPVYAIDADNIEYGECDILFPIERITHEIGLIPIKQTLSPDVTFSLHAEFDKSKVPSNDTSFEPRNIITSNDIKSSNGLDYFHPDMSIIELRKYVGKLHIDKMTLIRKPQLYHARHQACKTFYQIVDDKEGQVTTELTLKPVSRKYPEYSMDTYTAFKESIQILIDKCKTVRSNIENDVYITSESVISGEDKTELKLVKYKIDDESRQFGYLLQCQIFNTPGYSGDKYLVGFHHIHPLTRAFILAFQWDNSYHKGTPKKFLIKTLTALIKTLVDLRA